LGRRVGEAVAGEDGTSSRARGISCSSRAQRVQETRVGLGGRIGTTPPSTRGHRTGAARPARASCAHAGVGVAPHAERRRRARTFAPQSSVVAVWRVRRDGEAPCQNSPVECPSLAIDALAGAKPCRPGPRGGGTHGNVPMYDCGVPAPPKLTGRRAGSRASVSPSARTWFSFAATSPSASSHEIRHNPGSSRVPCRVGALHRRQHRCGCRSSARDVGLEQPCRAGWTSAARIGLDSVATRPRP